jgi:hypothetical protein
MAAPLNTCAITEQRGVVRFLWPKGMAAKDIHKEMLPVYGEHCLSRQAVHNCVQIVLGRANKYRRRTSSRSAGGDCHGGKDFYAAGFQGLVKRWDKCLNLY